VKPRVFDVLVIVSLAVLCILLLGYFCSCGPALDVTKAGPPLTQKEFQLRLDRGRVCFYYIAFYTSSTATGKPTPPGTSVRWMGTPLPHLLPDVRRSVWEFDAHWLTAARWKGYLLAFPIWCAALPFLIAPGTWFYKRRQRQSARGFPVQSAAVTA
jgi:hypothetical protein